VWVCFGLFDMWSGFLFIWCLILFLCGNGGLFVWLVWLCGWCGGAGVVVWVWFGYDGAGGLLRLCGVEIMSCGFVGCMGRLGLFFPLVRFVLVGL